MRRLILALLPLLAACDADEVVGPAPEDPPEPVYAPNNGTGDGVGVGVIDVDPSAGPYQVGPNPPKQPNQAGRPDESEQPERPK